MGRVIAAILVGCLVGAAAGNAALVELFDVTLGEIWTDLDDRGPVFAAALALPLLLWLLKGWVGLLLSTAVLVVGVAAGLKFGVDSDMPWDQAAVVAGTYGLGAMLAYKLVLARIF